MFYGTFGIIFGVFFVYIAIRESLTMKNLVGIGMAASNTWGLTATVALLGYGLVDVPRRWWERCQTEKWMEILYFGVAKATQELDEVNEDLENATKEIHVIKEMVDESHEMYDRVQLIAYKAPLYDAAAQRRGRRNLPVIRCSDIDEKMLVKLHRTIIRTVHLKERCQAIYDTLMERAMVHEDIMHGRYRVHFNESDGFMDKAYKRMVYLWQTQGYRVFAAL
ncbi:hypothetical protein SARC_07200 [Sphaeroforma arctica JP610]|uniref:Uncharacterized protein n=1 Tax=Sphaeroforma arctica JP610 TaxID=667725 RepID=A0A0L0FUB7_9EUKA|nr:hypothetical protein SARC_07200 [Sphaeroforma arctica JP610]KNC80440.1 hypothetical protein SARC_07200 [Sphaeroforma arctica JP610]|eukprot:XP_014154342.1 hypothetical protein SARC_07200 [Sphaeroforma arctica JP610]